MTDTWRILNPPPTTVGFTYTVTFDNGYCRRHYIGSKTFQTDWQSYSGSGKLPIIWRNMFPGGSIDKSIISWHMDIRAMRDHELELQERMDAINSMDYLNLIYANDDISIADFAAINVKSIKQIASWFKPRRKSERWPVIAVMRSGFHGYKCMTSAARDLGLTPGAVSNIIAGRRHPRHDTLLDIVAIPMYAVPYIQLTEWND